MFKSSFNLLRKSLFSTSVTEPRVFFGNFPFGTTDFAIRKFFDGCGEIKSVEFFKSDQSGTKGFGSVLFNDATAFENACKLNSAEFEGKPVTIKPWEGDYRKTMDSRPLKPVNPPSSILYIGNLAFDIERDELMTVFADYGNIISCRRPFDTLNNRPKGYFYFIKF